MKRTFEPIVEKGFAHALLDGSDSPNPRCKTHQYTWDELKEIDERRRAILRRCENGLWRTLSNIDGSVLGFLLRDSLFWITILIFIMVRIQVRIVPQQIPVFVEALGDGKLVIIGGFISLFVTMYVEWTFRRYGDQYQLSSICMGRIMDVASLANIYLPKHSAERIVRYLNAAHVSGYIGLSDTYLRNNFFVNINEDYGLLTESELGRIDAIGLQQGSSAYRELIVWCLNEVYRCHSQGILDHKLARHFRTLILGHGAAIGKLESTSDFAMPFFFVHFLCLVSAIYLPLFAAWAAFEAGTGTDTHWSGEAVAGLVVVLQAMYLSGLRILGQKMSESYGDDLTDFSVVFFVHFTWTASNRILESQILNPDHTEEAVLKNWQICIGDAWE